MKFGNGQWATKKDSILAYNDENANFKPLPFVTSRASTATRVNKAGLLETVASGIPRVDYLGNTKGAYLLEPQSTNLVTYSEDFSQSIWQKNSTGSASAPIITSNFAISPTGNTNATRVQFNISGSTSSDKSSLEHLFQLDGSSSYTLSFYIKSNTGVNQNLSFFTNSNYGNRITTTNKWIRVVQTFSSNSAFNRGFGLVSSGDVQQTVDVLIFGAQLEQQSYATSYIPTAGSAITRIRDLCDTQNLSNVIGQTEGAIFYDAILVHKSINTSEDLFELTIYDGTNQNIFFINNYNNTLTIGMQNGGSTQFTNNSFNPTEGARYRLGFAYKQNDFALYINGNQIATDTSGTVPTMNQITFGNYYSNQTNLQNSVKVNDFKLYNTRLSNTELAKLTKI